MKFQAVSSKGEVPYLLKQSQSIALYRVYRPHPKHMTWRITFLCSHEREEAGSCDEHESSIRRHCCCIDAFKSSRSFLDITDSLFCCWFDLRRFFTSFKSSLMTFTASSNEEDSHHAMSSTVDCASTDDRTTTTPIIVMRNARLCALDIVIKRTHTYLLV